MGVRIVLTKGGAMSAQQDAVAQVEEANTAAAQDIADAIEQEYFRGLREKIKRGTLVVIDMDDGHGDQDGIVTGIMSSGKKTLAKPPIYNVLRFDLMDRVTINTANPNTYIEPLNPDEGFLIHQIA